MLHQLPLPIMFSDTETFDSFYSEGNEILMTAIKAALSDPAYHYIYFGAAKGAGRSHLLRAACHLQAQQGEQVAYIPLDQHTEFPPALLDGMELLPLICLDNIEFIRGNAVWELAIFNLFNRIKDASTATLLIGGNAAPRHIGLALNDLTSRLDWGQVYQLNALTDERKVRALQHRAHLRGMALTDESALYLISRLDREMRTLFAALDKLEYNSIAEKRKLTIPFIKASLNI